MRRGFSSLVLVVAGCSFYSMPNAEVNRWIVRPSLMRADPAAPLTPPPGQALVVFVQPSDYGRVFGGGGKRNNALTIVDENGRFLGDSEPVSSFAAAVSPGKHRFAIASFTAWDALEAELSEGKIYFVEVGVYNYGTNLLAIKKGLSSWVKRDEWMRITRQLVPDTQAGEERLKHYAPMVQDSLTRGNRQLDGYQGKERDERTLAAADGL